MTESALKAARHFLFNEKQFHLGMLITEQPHPLTLSLSETIANDTAAGIRMLLEVDQDILPVAERFILSREFEQLGAVISETLQSGRTICFSSCGASGRLAILLEAFWRESRREQNDQIISIMTGGDRALIRSVENFEDYQSFGRRQVQEARLSQGDLLIAITEGGEISSVIGSMKEALERGCRVIMTHNNPAPLLMEHFERSREVLEHSGVMAIDLTTGPMALTGSTRLQATTIAMLVLGAALEQHLEPKLSGADFVVRFSHMLSHLRSDASVRLLAKLCDMEYEVYRRGGLVTYLADHYQRDILSDTTERTPTFMIPPFRSAGDLRSPVPWSFVKNPSRDTQSAWKHLLQRPPRGLSWKSEDYRFMGAPPVMIEQPPLLDAEQIGTYQIGNEPDASRVERQPALLMGCLAPGDNVKEYLSWLEKQEKPFTQIQWLSFIQNTPLPAGGDCFSLPDIDSPLRLTDHLAIKMVFNTISTAAMARLGRIRGNWMVQVDATNKKLIDRATRIIAHLAALPYLEACEALFKTMHQPNINRLEFKESYVVQTLHRLGIR